MKWQTVQRQKIQKHEMADRTTRKNPKTTVRGARDAAQGSGRPESVPRGETRLCDADAGGHERGRFGVESRLRIAGSGASNDPVDWHRHHRARLAPKETAHRRRLMHAF
jgi:hypothetical protein